MRPLFRVAAFIAAAAAAAASASRVVVFSASPAGIAAAVAVRRQSNYTIEAMVLEPSNHVGGMMAGGMMDDSTQGQPRAYAGIAREVFQRLAASKGHTGANKTCYAYLPSEIEAVFASLAEAEGVSVWLGSPLCAASVAGSGTAARRISEVKLCNGSRVAGGVFVDASYEGDLLALAGAPFALGREAASEWSESLAGVSVDLSGTAFSFGARRVSPWASASNASSGPAPLVCNGDPAGCEMNGGLPGASDGRVQSYNLRACVEPQGLDIPAPAVFDPAQWRLLDRYARAMRGNGSGPGAMPHGGFSDGISGYMGCHASASGACDTNDRGAISINQVGWQWAWPTASWETRRALLREHVQYTAGFLAWLRNSSDVPGSVRTAAAATRLCRTQFNDTDHWPWMTYVREGRRLQGDQVFTQEDYRRGVAADLPPGRSGVGGALSFGVGLGFWFLDSHEVQRVPARSGGGAVIAANEGAVQFGRPLMDAGASFDLPYGVMVTAAPGPAGARASAEARRRAAARGHATTTEGHWAAGGARMLLAPGGGAGGTVTPGGVGSSSGPDGGLTNLLVPVCASSTHVGFNPLRVEPTYQVLGQAAGTAAAIAVAAGRPVQAVGAGQLQGALRAAGAIVSRDDMPRLPPPRDAC